jgi:thiamine-monophosphate kinase
MEVPRSELQWIDRIQALAARSPVRRGMVLGVGDDCAIFRPRAGEDLVFTTDLLIEDIHFRRTYAPADVGHRALARGLSDIAAMGAAPRFCLLSLATTANTAPRWIDNFFRGLLRLADRTSTVLAGGDLARGHTAITADIVVCGAVARGSALRRDGAGAGDGIYVSGLLGGAALGLEKGPRKGGRAWRRHVVPEPRLALGRSLRGRATACIDLSDGLTLDLHRLALASGLAAEFDAGALPVFPGASEAQALSGGEDYELLFTLPPEARSPRGTTRIGTMRRGIAGRITRNGRAITPAGYDHFSAGTKSAG